MAENEQVIDSSAQSQTPVTTSVEVESPASAAPETTSETPVVAPVVSEKMIPQSQVNRIAAREAREAAEKATIAERARYAAEQAQANSQSQSQNIGGIQQHSPDDIRRMIHEEAFKMSNRAMAEQIEKDWLSTVNAEKDADPAFEKAYDALNIEQHPDLILWMRGMDNKVATLKDLAANPSKYANILMLATRAPQLAQMELNKLSESIKTNQTAQKQAAKIDAPLSQLKSSNISSDNGEMSVSDYRLIFKG